MQDVEEVAALQAGEPDVPWLREQADLARLVFALVVLACSVVAAAIYPAGLQSLTANLVRLVGGMPTGLGSFLLGTVQLAVVAGPAVGAVVLLATRQPRRLGLLSLAAGAALVIMAVLGGYLDRAVPKVVLDEAGVPSWLFDRTFPTAAYLAALVAALVADGPWLTRAWRRAGISLVSAAMLARLATAVEAPLNVVATVAVGAAVGSAVLLAVGAPQRRLSRAALLATLRSGGLDVTSVEPVAGADQRVLRYVAVTAEGAFDVKVAGRDQRDADALALSWRAMRVKGIDDDPPSANPGRAFEREALAGMLAREAGVRVAAARLVTEAPEGYAVLALERLDGVRLVDLDPDQVDDFLLDHVWHQVALLHSRRLAHGQLNAQQVHLVGTEVYLTGLRLADLAASDLQQAVDVAELLCSLALIVGAPRSVAAAVTVLGAQPVARALPVLQPLALSSDVRGLLKKRRGLIDEVREQVQSATDTPEFQLAKIERISSQQVLMLVATVFVVYTLLGQVAQADGLWNALKGARWSLVLLVAVWQVASVACGAVSMLGAVPGPLPFLRTNTVMWAQSFLNRFTPANAGGMALRVRYLQKRGTDVTVAATSIGVTSAASGVAQVVLMVVFFTWAGSSGSTGLRLPRVSTVALVVLLVAFVAGVVWLTPWGRRTLRPWVQNIVHTSVGSIVEIAKSPTKVALLMGGATFAKIATIVAFVTTMLAFGLSVDFPQIAAMYLTATTIASAVPTPGGVGAIEAALIAGLTGLGYDSTQAVSVVLVFRLVTYWMPVVPGYLTLGHLQRVEAV